MIRRKTQSLTYWTDHAITSEDLQHLSTLLVEDELPRSTEQLSRQLVLHHARQEEALIERALSKGTPYRPSGSYEVGQQVVFPVLDYRAGEVVEVRPGHNPEYDPFKVIKVRFDGGEEREFAAEFENGHVLNQRASGVADAEELRSPEELASLYGPIAQDRLEERLESEPEFVRLTDRWFRKDLLVDVHEGHLNLAEAVLDVAGGGPLTTEDLLGDVELPAEITPQLRIFSLNYALQKDERFDEVGPAGEVLWHLRRLEPEAIRSSPIYLWYEPVEYRPPLLTSEMRSLERRMDDEWSDLEPPEKMSEPVEIVLIYPHWRSGTLPLSSRLSQVFPSARTDRIRFTFVDDDTGAEMPGWVVQGERYVYGLEEWYRRNATPVGAHLEVSPGEEPDRIVIRPRNRRSRREWVRVALVREGKLAFEMHKEEIACDYDELMVMATGDLEELEKLWKRVQEQNTSLAEVVGQVFPELVKLSPQGNVHAETLYSAVNVVMRTPPGPLLEVLVTSDRYAPVGDNYWVLHTGMSGV
ncbi:MAG: hypothetical protein PVF54_07160 [Anaerolineae bacterium]